MIIKSEASLVNDKLIQYWTNTETKAVEEHVIVANIWLDLYDATSHLYIVRNNGSKFFWVYDYTNYNSVDEKRLFECPPYPITQEFPVTAAGDYVTYYKAIQKRSGKVYRIQPTEVILKGTSYIDEWGNNRVYEDTVWYNHDLDDITNLLGTFQRGVYAKEEEEEEEETQPNSEIWYTTTNGQTVQMGSTTGFGANFVSNTYSEDKGIIKFDGNINCIAENAFYQRSWNLKTVQIPSSITSIGKNAFGYCSELVSMNLPSSITSIGEGAFISCQKITSVVIPAGVTSISTSTFSFCSNLESITIPSGVMSIGNSAFTSCTKLTTLVLPEGLLSLGDYIFNYAGITSITIPSTVTSIGNSAFAYDVSLTEVVCNPATPPSLGSTAFTSNPTIKVPADSVDAYKAATNWSSYADHIVAQ